MDHDDRVVFDDRDHFRLICRILCAAAAEESEHNRCGGEKPRPLPVDHVDLLIPMLSCHGAPGMQGAACSKPSLMDFGLCTGDDHPPQVRENIYWGEVRQGSYGAAVHSICSVSAEPRSSAVSWHSHV